MVRNGRSTHGLPVSGYVQALKSAMLLGRGTGALKVFLERERHARCICLQLFILENFNLRRS